MNFVGTEAAAETTSVFGVISGRISSSTSAICMGFTASRITSALCAAARLSVVTRIPSCLPSALARSAWRTVADSVRGRHQFLVEKCPQQDAAHLSAPSTASRL